MKNTVHSILAERTDDESVWDKLHEGMTIINEEITYNDKYYKTLKYLFSHHGFKTLKLKILTKLLTKIHNIEDHFYNEIKEMYITLIFEKVTQNDSVIVGYSNMIKNMCTRNENFIKKISSELFKKLEKILKSKLQLSLVGLTEFFSLQSILLNDNDYKKNIKMKFNEEHYINCMKFIKDCKKSSTQIIIADWIYRAVNIMNFVKMSLKEIFKETINEFMSINSNNYKLTQHKFIEKINHNSSIITLHFERFWVGKKDYEIKGCIDIDENSITMFVFSNNIEIPDVVTFKFDILDSEIVELGKIGFRLLKANYHIRKLNEKNHSYLEFDVTMDKKTLRIIQNRLMHHMKSIGKGKDIIDKSIIKNTPKKDNHSINRNSDDNNKRKVEVVIRKLEAFHEKSKHHIEMEFTNIKCQINNIIRILEDQYQALAKLGEEHEYITKETIEKNTSIENTVKKLHSDFESQNNDTIKRRGNIKRKAENDLNTEIEKSLEETAYAFSHNALVALANAFYKLPETYTHDVNL